jgi:hypothetical protein
MLGLTFGKHAKRGITSWFVLAGVLHFALDGVFVIFGSPDNLASKWMAPWRHYAQEGDQRYQQQSDLIYSVQVLGAFVHGPLCFVAGWGMHKERNWFSIVGVLVSFCELYNRVILIATYDTGEKGPLYVDPCTQCHVVLESNVPNGNISDVLVTKTPSVDAIAKLSKPKTIKPDGLLNQGPFPFVFVVWNLLWVLVPVVSERFPARLTLYTHGVLTGKRSW